MHADGSEDFGRGFSSTSFMSEFAEGPKGFEESGSRSANRRAERERTLARRGTWGTAVRRVAFPTLAVVGALGAGAVVGLVLIDSVAPEEQQSLRVDGGHLAAGVQTTLISAYGEQGVGDVRCENFADSAASVPCTAQLDGTVTPLVARFASDRSTYVVDLAQAQTSSAGSTTASTVTAQATQDGASGVSQVQGASPTSPAP